MKLVDKLRALELKVDELTVQIDELKWAVAHTAKLCSECLTKYNDYSDALTIKALQKLKQEQEDGSGLQERT